MEPTTPPDIVSNITSNTNPLHVPPLPFRDSDPWPTLLAQGAEALIFKTHFLTPAHPCALKYRPSKKYRHPVLDARLTRHRILSEARILVRCRREGVNVPAVLSLNWEGKEVERQEGQIHGGWMMMEWIEGETIRKVLDGWLKTTRASDATIPEKERQEDLHDEHDAQLADLMVKIGRAVGKMHEIGIVHGDLTSSNLMLRRSRLPIISNGLTALPMPSLDGEIVLIDFGLAAQSVQDEDRAVDLYVLERAFGSTHPTAESLFKDVLKAYGTSYKGSSIVLKKLEEVRMRGRKRSMIG